MTKLPDAVTVEMCLFPRWNWQANDAATGKLVRRFQTTEQLNAFLRKHYPVCE